MWSFFHILNGILFCVWYILCILCILCILYTILCILYTILCMVHVCYVFCRFADIYGIVLNKGHKYWYNCVKMCVQASNFHFTI